MFLFLPVLASVLTSVYFSATGDNSLVAVFTWICKSAMFAQAQLDYVLKC